MYVDAAQVDSGLYSADEIGTQSLRVRASEGEGNKSRESEV